MTWEERLLFLMFLDYKGALKKWGRNHDSQPCGTKIDSEPFIAHGGFSWRTSPEGASYWVAIIQEWSQRSNAKLRVESLNYGLCYTIGSDTVEVGCQKITKKDALKIADFIYECFGEDL